MSFYKLREVTKIHLPNHDYFNLTRHIIEKLEALDMQLKIFPKLIADFENREVKKTKYERLTLVDKSSEIMLNNACEVTTNLLYSLSDILANFANKASSCRFKTSFNAIRKDIEKGKESSDVMEILGDLQWYKKVREIRTEITHYSSLFIVNLEGEIKIKVHSYRRGSDKTEFKEDIFCSIDDLIKWTKKAIETLDNFATYILNEYIVPKFDLEDYITLPKYDKDGIPILKDTKELRFDVERIKLGNYFKRLGIL